jgi:hypothetical protein
MVAQMQMQMQVQVQMQMQMQMQVQVQVQVQMQMQMQMQMLTALGPLGSPPPSCCPYAAAHTRLPCSLAGSLRVLVLLCW